MSEPLRPLAMFRAEVEQLSQAITPGEWHLAICCDEFGIVEGRANIEAGPVDVADDLTDADAAFIVAAPRLLREALAQIARLEDRQA
jgi:hypothetical protein